MFRRKVLPPSAELKCMQSKQLILPLASLPLENNLLLFYNIVSRKDMPYIYQNLSEYVFCNKNRKTASSCYSVIRNKQILEITYK
jgi:hypothetical protein